MDRIALNAVSFLNEVGGVEEVVDALGDISRAEVIAEALVEYRDRTGGFAGIDDVARAPGIGVRSLDHILRRLGVAHPGGDLKVRREGEALLRRKRWTNEWLDVSDRSDWARRTASAVERRKKQQPLARDAANVVRHADRRSGASVVGDVVAKVERVDNPAERATWGHTGTYVRVSADRAFTKAGLVVRLRPDQVRSLHAGSIVMARWSESAARFCLVPHSGFDGEEAAAYARITRPGIYTAIGLPTDPRILTTLRLARELRPWAALDQELDGIIGGRICELILCSNELNELLTDERVMEGTGIDPTAMFEGNVCDDCFGNDLLDPIVEIDLIDVFNPPILLDPPIVVFPIWPKRCEQWINLGPTNVTGRVSVIALNPDNTNTIYAAAASGGVWRSTTGGASWYPQMHDELSLAIGGFAVAPSNPAVLYAATGEWTNDVGAANNHFPGVGVYRSSNGGVDWNLLAPISSQNCAAVAIDPSDPERVFVAGETALHRTRDGGTSWDIPGGNTNGLWDGNDVSDVVLKPGDANTVYMGVHNDGFYRSTDGGATFTRISNGIATGAVANSPKIAVGIDGDSGADFVAVKFGRRVYTSTDSGVSFTQQTNVGAASWDQFFTWANVIAVDPTDEDMLIAGGANLYRSTDGGTSWTQVGGYSTSVHPDMQSVVFDQEDHDRVLLATDSGLYESTDNGATWSLISDGLVATQLWSVGVSQSAQLAYGSTLQDDGAYLRDTGKTWKEIRGNEGGYLEIDPSDHATMYADTWFVNLAKSTDGGTTWSNLGPDTDGAGPEPMAISPADGNRILVARSTGQLARTVSGGNSFTNVLTGVNISAVEYAASDSSVAYAGNTMGRVWRSSNGGAAWTELATGALPNRRIQDLKVDRDDPNRVYVAFSGTGIRHLWRGELDSTGAATWFDVSGALPAVELPDLPLTGLVLDPSWEETIYVSTLLGVYRSTDGGDSWAPFDEGLPNVFVSDLDVRERDRSLYVSTMGRGLYRRYI